MSIKYMTQLFAACFIFLLSTAATWYEGSNLTDDSFEWRDSAKYTSIATTPITSGYDISQVDYFIYAAKLYPFFPIMMLISGLYLLILLLVAAFKNRYSYMSFCLFMLATLLFLLGYKLSASPSIGGLALMKTCLTTGSFVLIFSFYYGLKFIRNHKIPFLSS
ncbi:YjdJ family protein [Priestia flexa]|jgi:Domain of unknown function (DUF4306)|uniref:DUF4306 domain-containing protein n=1 Tax=Priestia flexa TaxID=86664 RepID=A0A8I1SNE8_9BACI|nr:DUF4306 domain-containing protein [Priestia flexa]MBN8252005.1 DUF4306 domain-containing protein [Priestia flexa]MBN8435506.1 DUF4306 domain-containing protein [Priestia flexa]MCA0967916.1 YjdJ family protein [Priestia flexa]MCG7314607.1 YjdJ family protein [Priestia flexa]UIR28536.1 YjdJ family protein [Priestia flexa]